MLGRIALCGLLLVPLAAPAQTKVRLAGVAVGGSAGLSMARSPYFYPYFWDPWYYPAGLWPSFIYAPDRGEVKLQTADLTSEVFIDGAFAGTAEKLKSIWLQPGAYTLAVQPPGKPLAERRVYVLTGKTLKVKL